MSEFWCRIILKKSSLSLLTLSLHFFLSVSIPVFTDYRPNGRDFQSSTLSVPEQVMSSNHCSRSADINRPRSRSPSVPPPSRYIRLSSTLSWPLIFGYTVHCVFVFSLFFNKNVFKTMLILFMNKCGKGGCLNFSALGPTKFWQIKGDLAKHIATSGGSGKRD